MFVYAGIDEAGYGPMLGPLCVGPATFVLEKTLPRRGAPDLWAMLDEVVCRAKRDPRQRIAVDDSKTTADYANFCRLSGTPEELLIDFGLNPQPTSTTQPIAISQRIITGWHTAKRLLHVLQLTVDRHEAAFGVLETDVQKRVGHA